jgi:hypothetical protein
MMLDVSIRNIVFPLSAYAEDHGLCPWGSMGRCGQEFCWRGKRLGLAMIHSIAGNIIIP